MICQYIFITKQSTIQVTIQRSGGKDMRWKKLLARQLWEDLCSLFPDLRAVVYNLLLMLLLSCTLCK